MKSAIRFRKVSGSALSLFRVLKLPQLLPLLFFMASPGYSVSPVEYKGPDVPPVVICRNINVFLGNGGAVSITPSDIDAGSYDPDGTITSMTVVPNTFNCSNIGMNTVVLTVTDDDGNSASCTATVLVEDRMTPVASCKDHTIYLDAFGKAKLTPSDINNGSTDNCGGGLNFYLSRTEFSCSDIGSPVEVHLIVTDMAGNSSSCTSRITVLDTISPVINYRSFDLVIGSSGSATLEASDIDNGTYDNCGNVTLSVSPSVFTCSDLGQQTVLLTATDPHGNRSVRSVIISVSSTLKITGMSLSECDMAPALALFQADKEGGDGDYSYLWKGVNPGTQPFMVIFPLPPALQFSATSTLEKPFFNNTLPPGYHDIRLVVTDGNGCRDSSDIRVNNTGTIFNNQTFRVSEACEGQVKVYSVINKTDASYTWTVTNGTILDSNTDTCSISVLWNTGVSNGRVVATLREPNDYFSGGECESKIIDDVTLVPTPTPVFDNPATSVCQDAPVTYTLTSSFAVHEWSVEGGVIVSGGGISDNHVTVVWISGPMGTVSVSAGNNRDCMVTATLTVNVFNLQGSVISLSDISCNGGSDGSVVVAADPGSGLAPYTYSLDGGSFVAGGNFNGLSLGNHHVTIRDAQMCSVDIPFVIAQPAPVTGSVSSIDNVSCFGGSDGSVTINPSGGTPPYQFRLNSGDMQGSNVFKGLPAGAYTGVITDSNGCTGFVLFSITQPVMPLDGSASVTNVSCFGETTGEIVLTVSGGTEPYSYLWNNGSTLKNLTGLAAGDYYVTVTDANGCTLIISAPVTQPSAALAGSASVTDVLCYGEPTGSAALSISGGTPPYSFLWSNGTTTKDITGVQAGNYSVTIKDYNECILVLNVPISQPDSPLGGVVSGRKNVSCFGGNDGAFTLNGSGGTPPYAYSLNMGPFQPTGKFDFLPAGVYTATVRDANNCTRDIAVTITQPALPLGGNIVSLVNVGCHGEATGQVRVAGSGGRSPYVYSIDGGPFRSSGTFTGLKAGPHDVTVRDANQCIFVVPVIISEPSLPLTVTVTHTDILCKGTPGGTALATPAGGTAPYTYSWNSTPVQNTAQATGLSAGNYTVTVTDFNGCLVTAPVSVSEPLNAFSASVSVTDASCNGSTDGSAIITVSDGLAPYTYLWSNGAVTENLTGVPAGNYPVVVTDANGCVANAEAVIGQPSPVSGKISTTDVICFGENNGSCSLTVNGGTPPYTYLWSNGVTSKDLDNIPAGTYSVAITDSKGCTLLLNAIVGQPTAPTGGTIVSVTDATAYGESDGEIVVQGTGGTPPYQYALTPGLFQASGTFSSLPAGTHNIRIRDSRSCLHVIQVTVGQPALALQARILSKDDVSCFGLDDGRVMVEGWGGTGPYMYSLNGASYQSSGIFASLPAGLYTIYVRDGTSDVFSLPVEINEPDPIELDIVKNMPRCMGGEDGSAEVIVTGGTAPYSFLWDTDPEQTTGTAFGLAAGSYTVTVTDKNGCIGVANILLSEPSSELVLNLTKTDVLCGGGTTGSATVTASGGQPPYFYSWDTSPVQTGATATNLAEGSYTVNVTDSNGCLKIGTVAISSLPQLNLSASVTDASCPDSKDGSVNLAISGGTAPYSIFWSDGFAGQTRNGLLPGNYEVVVSDHNGCSESLVAEVGFSFSVNCLVIPQVITPNGDGFNDEWRIRNIEFYPNAEVRIFNRWGQEVFATRNPADNPWDGRYKGKLVPTDSYHYILYLNDGSEPRTGIISVIR